MSVIVIVEKATPVFNQRLDMQEGVTESIASKSFPRETTLSEIVKYVERQGTYKGEIKRVLLTLDGEAWT